VLTSFSWHTRLADIPVVHVSVQGGSEAIRTMLNTVIVSLPLLLVRGTGKVASCRRILCVRACLHLRYHGMRVASSWLLA